jgi:ABC-type multidrug transport system permease subunit
MIRGRPLRELAWTTFREFARTPEALFWTYGFPLIVALVLGLAFASGRPDPVPVVVADGPAATELAAALQAEPRLIVRQLPPAEAERALHHGDVDLLLAGSLSQPQLRLDPTRAEAEPAKLLAERALHRAAGRLEPLPIELREETAPGSRYIDWLIPGLVGMNLLGAGLFGIGYNLVNMRVRQLLRLLVVSPMGRAEFLLAYMLSRMILVVPESLVIILFGRLVFGVPFEGSFLAVVLLILLGGAMFNGLGLLIASRARTLEAVGGWMNLLMIPMWLLGGVFFSHERFPAAVQPLIQALPMTHLCDAIRNVMLGGAPIWAVGAEIGIMVAFSVGFFLLALRLFRWA